MKGEMERFWCSELTVWYLCVVCALNSPGVLNIALMIRNPLLCDARLQPLALRVALLALIMLFWMWTSTKAFGPWLFLSHVIHGNSYRAKQQSSRAPSFAGNHPPCELVDCCGWPRGMWAFMLWWLPGQNNFKLWIVRPRYHFSSTSLSSNIVPWLWHRLCVDTLLRVYTHNVMMDEPSFDGWAPLSGSCGLGSLIKGSNLLLSI